MFRVIVEPVQGRAGGRLNTASTTQSTRDVTRVFGIVIFDEVFTGLGRIGSYAAFDVDTDMVALVKH